MSVLRPHGMPSTSPGSFLRAGVLAVLGAVALPLSVPAAVTTTFDASAEGWLVTGDNASVWSATGGNPGGCFDVNDLATGGNNFAVAPPAYLGDWSAMTAADSISVDLFFQQLSGTVSPGPFLFRISGPGGAAYTLPGYVPPQNVWTTVTAALDPAGWVIESGTWGAVLAHVNTVLIEVEFISGNEEVRFDNVRLTGTVTPIFDPCVGDMFDAADLGDWSFASTGGVTNPGSGGNGGGYCRVADGAGASYAFAPARFLGDWSALDGTGRITLDFRLVSYSGPIVDVPEFVRLTGPGGVARMPLAAVDVPVSTLQWKRLEFPLQASAWTMVSGTWAGLLANVTECRIQAEVVNGSEVVGLDNFTRRAAGCPDLDEPLVFHTTEFAACGYESFVTIGGIGFNPADGQVYGLLDAASGSGGGLYRITGPGSGVRLQAYTTPAHVLFDGSGNAFISEDSGGNVFRWSGGTSSVWVSGFHAGDDDPTGMCFAPAGFDGPNVDPGDILVTDPGFSGPDEVWSFKPGVAEGELQVVADLAGDPDFRDIATGPAGVVYTVTTTDPNNLYSLSPTGVLTAIPLSTPLTGMISLVFDAAEGRVYVVENGGHTLRRIDPGTGNVELIASGFVTFADGALEIGAGGHLLVADNGKGRVYRICRTSTTALPEVAAGAVPGPADLSAISVEPNPARRATRVAWTQRRAAPVRVTVYDVAGRIVRDLGRGTRESGPASAEWDGRDDAGRLVGAGVYFVRLETDREARTARVTRLR